jgi:hypothetical protein
MNITLELPSELEQELTTEASKLKLPLTEYVLRILFFRPFLQNPPKTGVSSRSDIDNSQEHIGKVLGLSD